MNCSQARRDIALWVGQDLDDVTRRVELRSHLAECVDCHQHFRRMKRTYQLLERADQEPTFQSGDSLWPAVATRIAQPHRMAPLSRFNGWMPFVAMTAACLTLMLVVNERPDPQAPVMRGPSALTMPIPVADPISLRGHAGGPWEARPAQGLREEAPADFPDRSLHRFDGRFE